MNREQFKQVKALLLSDNEEDFQLALCILKAKKMEPGKHFWDELNRESFWKFSNFPGNGIYRKEHNYLYFSGNKIKLNPKKDWNIRDLENVSRFNEIVNYEEIKEGIKRRIS